LLVNYQNTVLRALQETEDAMTGFLRTREQIGYLRKGVDAAQRAVEIAREFGAWLGGRGIPVYYYEDAATRPERKSLPKIRKGQYEALEEKLRDAAWAPDEGPAEFNATAGATVTGSRFPLIAFNVNLRTDDLEIAKTIARAIRHINGGYKAVRGMGFALEERDMVQVSMNLVNYTKTPIFPKVVSKTSILRPQLIPPNLSPFGGWIFTCFPTSSPSL